MSPLRLFAILGLVSLSLAANPIRSEGGLADPHVHVWDDGTDSIYLYATHDYAGNKDDPQGFRMDNWWVWTTSDLVNWTLVDTLQPSEIKWDTPAEVHECWATDAAQRNGYYYFYLSVGPTSIGVVRSERPAGPFTDVLGKALVAPGDVPTQARDPCAFQDADGSFYLVFGTFDYYIAKLNEDMMSFAETPRKIDIINPAGPYGPGKTDDKPFLYAHNSTYFLTWGCFYSTGASPYGPFTFRGTLLDANENSTFYPSAFRQGGGVMDRHGSYFTLHGQTYFAYNDRSHGGNQYFRNTLISYVNYFSNGSIPMLNVSAVGVGSLNVTADAPRVEAEQFFKITNASKTEIPMSGGQFEVSSLGNGSSLYYAKVYCQQTGVYSIALHVSNGSPTAGLVTISDGRQKTVLATCMVAPTGAWTTYQDVVCKGTVKLNPGQGTDLAFVFSARGADAFAHLDYWEIRST